MYIKVQNGRAGKDADTAKAAGDEVYRLLQERRERPGLPEKLGVLPDSLGFFDMKGNSVEPGEVVWGVMESCRGVGEQHKEDKFFTAVINPSDREIVAIGGTLVEKMRRGKECVIKMMTLYAANFQRPGESGRHTLSAWAIPHLYKKKNNKVPHLHWHMIVGRIGLMDDHPVFVRNAIREAAIRSGFSQVEVIVEQL